DVGLLLFSSSVVSANFLRLNISAKIAVIDKENIIPKYGGRCVSVLNIGTNIMNPSPKYSIIEPYVEVLLGTSFNSCSCSISPLKFDNRDVRKVGMATQAIEGSKTC